jgi:hypothetical protein
VSAAGFADGPKSRHTLLSRVRISGRPPVLTFVVAKDARVQILLARQVIRKGRRTKDGKQPKRLFVRAGVLKVQAKASKEVNLKLHGPNGRALRPGTYVATLFARAGEETDRQVVDFKVATAMPKGRAHAR